MTESIAVYNIALIFDAINTYSVTFREYLDDFHKKYENGTEFDTGPLETDSNEFFLYLTERLESVQKQHQSDNEMINGLQSDLTHAEEEIVRLQMVNQELISQQQQQQPRGNQDLQRQNQELRNHNHIAQQTIQQQDQTIQQLQLQLARLQGNGRGTIGTKKGQNRGQNDDDYQEMENKITMLQTNINLLESELDTAGQHILSQEEQIDGMNDLMQRNEEKMIANDVMLQKIKNENEKYEKSIQFHKQSYVKVKTDYYKLQNANTTLRQELSDALLGNHDKLLEIRPLEEEIVKWKNLYETLHLKTTLTTAKTLTSPTDLDLSTISTSQQQQQLILSLQLELKMMRFERDLNEKQLQSAKETLQNWDSSIQTYHNLYSKYFTTLNTQQESYRNALSEVGARYGAISTLLQLFLKAIPKSLLYRQAYFNTLTRLASAQMDTQLLLARVKQQVDNGIEQLPLNTIQSKMNNNNTHTHHTQNTSQNNSFESRKITNRILIHHIKALRQTMVLDKQRLTAPLAFATQVYDAFNVLLKRYEALAKRIKKMKKYEKIVKKSSSDLHLAQNHINQLTSTLSSTQDRCSNLMTELNQANSDNDNLFLQFEQNKTLNATLQQQHDELLQTKQDLGFELNDLQLRYGHLMEQKVVLQTMYQRSGRENDSLRGLLNRHGIINNIATTNNNTNNNNNNNTVNTLDHLQVDPLHAIPMQPDELADYKRNLSHLERLVERKDVEISGLQKRLVQLDQDWDQKCQYYQKMYKNIKNDLEQTSNDLKSALDQTKMYSQRCDELNEMISDLEARGNELEGDLEVYIGEFFKFQNVGKGLKKMMIDGYFNDEVIEIINELFQQKSQYDGDTTVVVGDDGDDDYYDEDQNDERAALTQNNNSNNNNSHQQQYSLHQPQNKQNPNSILKRMTTNPHDLADSSFILSDEFDQMTI